jgi:hypothetical protein
MSSERGNFSRKCPTVYFIVPKKEGTAFVASASDLPFESNMLQEQSKVSLRTVENEMCVKAEKASSTMFVSLSQRIPRVIGSKLVI